jgi:hypothetical protein
VQVVVQLTASASKSKVDSANTGEVATWQVRVQVEVTFEAPVKTVTKFASELESEN